MLKKSYLFLIFLFVITFNSLLASSLQFNPVDLDISLKAYNHHRRSQIIDNREFALTFTTKEELLLLMGGGEVLEENEDLFNAIESEKLAKKFLREKKHKKFNKWKEPILNFKEYEEFANEIKSKIEVYQILKDEEYNRLIGILEDTEFNIKDDDDDEEEEDANENNEERIECFRQLSPQFNDFLVQLSQLNNLDQHLIKNKPAPLAFNGNSADFIDFLYESNFKGILSNYLSINFCKTDSEINAQVERIFTIVHSYCKNLKASVEMMAYLKGYIFMEDK